MWLASTRDAFREEGRRFDLCLETYSTGNRQDNIQILAI